jgi:predicted AlkP superfamily phosphohydrolase/phosphomutase
MKKVFIIGLDGAPYKEVKEWIEEGKLPFLSKLAKEGAFGRLKSIVPAYSMIAWPVICTGKNPAKIGPFLYKGEKRGFDPDYFSSAQFINSTDIKTWSIWEWASLFKRKVGIVNIPMTYPPTKVNGFEITGFLTPKGAKNFTYPPELKDELNGYRIDIALTGGAGFADRKVNKKKRHKDLLNLLEERTEWVLKLIQKYNPDLFMINFKEMDNFMHAFWDKKELVFDYFKRADSSVERIYELAKPDNIMVISDHGFTKAPIKYFYINQYLEDKGFLKRAENVKGKFSNFMYKAGSAVVKKYGFVRNFFPDSFKIKITRKNMKEKVNWEKTRVYSNWYAGIYLNPKYYTDEESKKKGALEVKELLLDAKDSENGKEIFLEVNTKWEVYEGKYFDEMPDIVYTTTEDYKLSTNLPGILIEERFAMPDLVGHHFAALEGIVFIHGEKIKKGVRIDGSLQDIFPTACILSGFPIPDDVDGNVIKEALKEGSYKEEFKNLPYSEEHTIFLTEEEDKSVKEHLKGLGYI